MPALRGTMRPLTARDSSGSLYSKPEAGSLTVEVVEELDSAYDYSPGNSLRVSFTWSL
jgi:hypothetical protein